jgi:hypothetical protein
MMAKTKTYFTLVSRSFDDQRWGIEFGAYDRQDVEGEMECEKDRLRGEGVEWRIVMSADDQPAVDAAVAKLQANSKPMRPHMVAA